MEKKLIPNNKWLAIDPADVLRTKCKPVLIPLSKENQKLITKMQEFIDATFNEKADQYQIKKGIAIAAPQLGVPVQIIYIHFNEEKKIQKDTNDSFAIIEHQYLLANPKIISESLDYVYLDTGEGCLSVDQKYPGYVFRKRKIIVEAFDLLQNKDTQFTMENFLSICFQHEFDHLNGILYYDRISKNDPFEIRANAKKINN